MASGRAVPGRAGAPENGRRRYGEQHPEADVAEGLVEVDVVVRLVGELGGEQLGVLLGVLVLVAVHGTRRPHATDTGPHQHT